MGGFSLFQAVLQPAAGADRDKLLPSSTLLYLSYNASPSADKQANWNKLRDAFLSQPEVKQVFDQYGPQAQYALSAVGSFTSQCSTGDVNVSILASLNEWVNGNVTIAWMQPSDGEIRSLVRTLVRSFGFGSGSGSSNSQPTCAALSLFDSHAVAIVSLDATPLDTNGLIATLQNKSKAENKGSLSKAETYSGMDIYKLDLGGSVFYGAIIGRQAALSGSKNAVEAVVDASKDSSKSLPASTAYSAELSKFPSDRTATFYLDTSKLAEMASVAYNELNGEGMNTSPLYTNLVSQLQSNPSGLLVGITARANGVQIDLGGNGLPVTLPQMGNRNLVSRIPADAWGLLTSADLKGLVNQLLSLLNSNQSLLQSLNLGVNLDAVQVKQLFQQSTSLNLDNDILSWLGGEWVAYVSPYPNPKDYVNIAFTTFVLDVHDSKDKAQAGIQKINQLLKDGYITLPHARGATPTNTPVSDATPDTTPMRIASGYQVTEVQVAGSTIYKVGSDPAVYYGIVGDYFYITNGTSAIEAFNSGKGGITDSTNYKGATQNAISNNGAMLYLNFQPMLNTYEGYMRYRAQQSSDSYYTSQLNTYEQSIKPFLIPFRSASVSDEGDQTSQHLVLFVDIEK